jgi:hypothetical protein
LEQTSHHPPTSHYILYGPNNNFKYYGYSLFSSSAGFNSLKVINKGKRFVEFKDGSKIEFNFCEENFGNCFWGTVNLQSLGILSFIDKKNNIECILKLKYDTKK